MPVVSKCQECKYSILERYNGSPSRYYCKHPNSPSGVASLIGKCERHSEVMKRKRAPTWCPERTMTDNKRKSIMLAENIRTFMMFKKMNPDDLIEATGLERFVIWSILYAKFEQPKEDDLNKIATALGVTVKELTDDLPDNIFFNIYKTKLTDSWNQFGGETNNGKATYLK